jgi:hypothetical protein
MTDIGNILALRPDLHPIQILRWITSQPGNVRDLIALCEKCANAGHPLPFEPGYIAPEIWDLVFPSVPTVDQSIG